MTQSPILILQKQKELLKLEYDYEKEQFRRQTENAGVKRKVKRGVCWWPLRTGRSYYNSLNQLVVEVERTEDLDTEHSFEPGKPVCFFTQDASGDSRKGVGGFLHYMPFTATVSYVDDNRMVVALPSPAALQQVQAAERMGVQLYLDETTYRLMFEALDRVIQARTGRLAELRNIFHGSRPTEKFAFAPTRFPWLNTTQQAAVNEVLWAKDVAVVHGPPGTGKTTTLVEAIYETLRRENQVMVCAQSNMAVDWIAEKLTDRGVAVLRIGNPTRITDKMLSFTYERRFENHPHYTQLWAIRRAIRDLYASRPGHSGREAFHQKVARLRDRATELEIAIRQDLFAEARVIACTLTGSAHRVLTGMKFSTLFIDEAAQALEAACWIALQKADRVVLAGDHQQLPPTLKCPEAQHGGLDRTLMQSIVENKPRCVSLLEVQYRMNERIMQFSSEWFYEGRLKSAPEIRYRGILDWDNPMEWIDTADEESVLPLLPEDEQPCTEAALNFEEETHEDGTSRFNRREARLTLNALKRYLTKIGKERILAERIDTGIISPYKGQVQLLRHLLRQDPFFKTFRPFITVNTVDGFQGQERDIILISMVRNNREGRIGFLTDLRRMNVAITRARMKLIILGDSHTLGHLPFYRRLLEYVRQEN
ncbi:MAG: AAA domain-containing protein [Clostridium sp.]|nr:AAA domain-containing protein [Clostridium sp.]